MPAGIEPHASVPAAAERPSRLLISTALAVLILVWGSTWSVIRVSLEGFPPLTGVALRFAVAAAVLTALGLAIGVRFGRERRERRLWLIQAVVTFGVPYCVVFWAEQWVPSGLVAVLFATFPLFVIPLGRLVLGERPGLGAVAGILIGFAGVATIFSDEISFANSQVTFAAACTLLAPVCAAFGQVSAKRWGHGLHSFSLAAVPMGLAAVGSGLLALAFERHLEIAWQPRPVLALLYLALAGSVLTFSVFYWVLQHVTSLQMSLITYAIPVVAVTLGTVFLDEPLTTRMLLGAALVLVGVVFAVRAARR